MLCNAGRYFFLLSRGHCGLDLSCRLVDCAILVGVSVAEEKEIAMAIAM